MIKEATKKGYAEAYEGDYVNLQYPNSKTRRECVGKQIAQTLQCNDGGGVVVSSRCVRNREKDKGVGKGIIIYDDYNSRIRADQTCIGTITTNIGSSTPRNGTKIIEIKEVDAMNENTKPIRAGFFEYPNSDKAHQSNTFYDANGISPTLDTCTGGNRQTKIIDEAYGMQNLRIRKLTPKECWRLMGFDDADIDKCIEQGISNSRLYMQAGNSIAVDVLYYLFGSLKDALPEVFE